MNFRALLISNDKAQIWVLHWYNELKATLPSRYCILLTVIWTGLCTYQVHYDSLNSQNHKLVSVFLSLNCYLPDVHRIVHTWRTVTGPSAAAGSGGGRCGARSSAPHHQPLATTLLYSVWIILAQTFSASGSAGLRFDPRRGSEFSFENFQPRS